eukprot:GGOE01048790.1.p1 GENE.GGOE01048790.1~~GGOE01048790.1.p1  ORF type:complete len:344 (-),score=99.85 GGOE01048790.1:103-981(-)
MFTKTAGHRTPEDKYNALWNGLRVRIGIHYGMGDVLYDEVSKGYDFYGTVVNAAARIEALAHGGQVVVTEDLLAALPTPLDPNLGLTKALGTVPLRGVAEPPALVQVKPTALKARKFPPLRVQFATYNMPSEEGNRNPKRTSFRQGLDLDSCTPDSEDGITIERRSSDQSAVSRNSDCRPVGQIAEDFARTHAKVRSGLLPLEVAAQQLLTLYHTVEDLLMPLAPQQFTTVAKALAKGWGVIPPTCKSDCTNRMRLVQRMSETTQVFAHFSHLMERPSSKKVDEGLVEVEVV